MAAVPTKQSAPQGASQGKQSMTDVQALRQRARQNIESGAVTTDYTGDRDTIVSPQIHSRALAAILPHSKLVVLEGVGHMAHHVATDRVIAAIEEVTALPGR